MFIFEQDEPVSGQRELHVQMVDGVDLVTPKTGLTLSVEIVKPGSAAYAAITGTWAEVGSGTYKITLAIGDLAVLGMAMVKITASGAANQYVPIQVLRFPKEVHLAKAALVNKREHTIETGVDVILDDDGNTELRTLTPAEAEGVITVTPS